MVLFLPICLKRLNFFHRTEDHELEDEDGEPVHGDPVGDNDDDDEDDDDEGTHFFLDYLALKQMS